MRFKRSGVTEDILLTRSNIGNISNVNRNGTNTARGYNASHGLTTVTGGKTQTYDNVGRQSAGGQRVDRIFAVLRHRGVFCSRRCPTREVVLGAQPPEDWRRTFGVVNLAGSPQVGNHRPCNTNSLRKLLHHSGSKFPAGATAGIQGLNENGYVGGNRIWKKITRGGSVVEHRVHIHAGPNLVAEYYAGVAASTPVQEYVYAGEIDSLVLNRRSDATKYGVTRNGQRNITALHDLANGTVVERYAYDMTGKRTIYAANGTTVRTTSSYGNHFGYTSRWHDEDSGLMYFRARYYNPLTGEFLSRDPMEFVDGMSLYRGYFGINHFDPHGTDVWGIDGTWADADKPRLGMTNVKRFEADLDEPFHYYSGTGSAIPFFLTNGATGYSNRFTIIWVYVDICKRFCLSKEVERCKGPTNFDVGLFGWSRGAVGVVEVAEWLQQYGCTCGDGLTYSVPVKFLGLFDPVDMHARSLTEMSPIPSVFVPDLGPGSRFFWPDDIPSNVAYSAAYYRNSGTDFRSIKENTMYPRKFYEELNALDYYKAPEVSYHGEVGTEQAAYDWMKKQARGKLRFKDDPPPSGHTEPMPPTAPTTPRPRPRVPTVVGQGVPD